MPNSSTDKDSEFDSDKLVALMQASGAVSIYIKWLAPNDNSKNQIYCGPNFSALNILPNKGVEASATSTHFKAQLDFSWIDRTGGLRAAPSAQLILYPQYPEIRLSGILRGAKDAPNEIVASRQSGRVLVLGICRNGEILAHAGAGGSAIARSLSHRSDLKAIGAFFEVPIRDGDSAAESRERLLNELSRIYAKGWIGSKRLGRFGVLSPCNSSNCGGYTLEAELGISANGFSEPDFLGWEIKQHSVASLDKPSAGVLTLMTPEPTGGIYKSSGVKEFLERFGYADKRGRDDRINFGGIFRTGVATGQHGLKLELIGYDEKKGIITDANGGISLVSPDGEVAAIWHYAGLLKHWNRKHARAAYVPSTRRLEPSREYRFGAKVLLCEGTDFLRFMQSLSNGTVYYDPGIKMEAATSPRPEIKRRSQFRVKLAGLKSLYESAKHVDVSNN